MTDINLFSTPIYRAKVINSDIDALLSASDFLSFLEDNKVWNCSVETSYFNKNRVQSESYKALSSLIERDIFPFVVNYLSPLSEDCPIKIETSEFWVNRYFGGKFQEQHNHPSSTVSFVYVHKTSPSHSFLRFHNKDSFLLADIRHASGLIFSRQTVDFDLSQGEVIIFPSFLEHSVVPNNSEGERITLSGNIRVCRHG